MFGAVWGSLGHSGQLQMGKWRIGKDSDRKELEEERNVRQLVTVYLFDQFDCGLQVKPKVDPNPINTLTFVLFLFEYKHVVIEELLQLFICKVDAQLLKAIELRKSR